MSTNRPTQQPNRHSLDQSPFYKLKSKARLSLILQAPQKELRFHSTSLTGYAEFDLISDKGKKRHIQTPKPALRRIHNRIEDLLSRIEPPWFLFCPVKGRSYISNACQHLDSGEVVKLDIKDYFPSTHAARIFWFFNTKLKCSPDVAGILTSICACDGHLTTGSPLSPVLSFWSHWDMWEKINGLTKEHDCIISVYVDDVTISGPRVPERLIWSIKQEIFRHGLRYHKERRFNQDGAKLITGVVIKGGELRLPNKQHLKIHNLRKKCSGFQEPEKRIKIKNQLRGCLNQANQVLLANDPQSPSSNE